MGSVNYTHKGLYNSYDKNHKERDALDYYATPTAEVKNILDVIKLPLSGATILEPCVGAGHMLQGILSHLDENSISAKILCTDIKDRGGKIIRDNVEYKGLNLDFFADDYPINSVDYIIMNPPYSVIEPFTIRALEIAKKGVLMLARIQFLEGEKRYESILKNNPPNDVYIYIDRIKCYKNGDFSNTESSAQCYAWYYWDINSTSGTKVHWIRRKN